MNILLLIPLVLATPFVIQTGSASIGSVKRTTGYDITVIQNTTTGLATVQTTRFEQITSPDYSFFYRLTMFDRIAKDFDLSEPGTLDLLYISKLVEIGLPMNEPHHMVVMQGGVNYEIRGVGEQVDCHKTAHKFKQTMTQESGEFSGFGFVKDHFVKLFNTTGLRMYAKEGGCEFMNESADIFDAINGRELGYWVKCNGETQNYRSLHMVESEEELESYVFDIPKGLSEVCYD